MTDDDKQRRIGKLEQLVSDAIRLGIRIGVARSQGRHISCERIATICVEGVMQTMCNIGLTEGEAIANACEFRRMLHGILDKYGLT